MAGPRIKITSESRVKKGINASIRQLRKLKTVAVSVNKAIARSLRGVGAIFRRVRGLGIFAIGALGGIGVAIKKAFDFEATVFQFKSLLGSLDAAKKRFKELREFSDITPFEIEPIIEASKQIENFGSGLLDNMRTLQLVGDAAAALGKDIQEVAFWYGRFFALTRGGQAAGEERRRLLELGILSAEASTELEKMAKAGMSVEAQMAVMNKQFSRFEGSMKDLSLTGNGLISTLKSVWTTALATFGDEFVKVSKESIQGMIDSIRRLTRDGSLVAWAKKTKDSLASVIDVGKDVAAFFVALTDAAKRMDALKGIGNVFKSLMQDAFSVAIKMLLNKAREVGELIAAGFAGAVVKAFPVLKRFFAGEGALRKPEKVGEGNPWKRTEDAVNNLGDILKDIRAGIDAFFKPDAAAGMDFSEMQAAYDQFMDHANKRFMGTQKSMDPLLDKMVEMGMIGKDAAAHIGQLAKHGPRFVKEAVGALDEAMTRMALPDAMGSVASQIKTRDLQIKRTAQTLQKFGDSAKRHLKTTLIAGGMESRLGFGGGGGLGADMGQLKRGTPVGPVAFPSLAQGERVVFGRKLGSEGNPMVVKFARNEGLN